MFSNCYLLEILSDISKWNINNLENISYMFFGCKSLKSLPDLSKIINKEIKKEEVFDSCKEDITLKELRNNFKIY